MRSPCSRTPVDLHAKPLRPIALLHVRYCLLPLQKHRLHNDISGLYHTALAQRCLRFAARVTPGPRKTRFRLGASLDRVDGAKLTSTGTQHEVSAQLMASSSSRLLLAHCNAVFGCALRLFVGVPVAQEFGHPLRSPIDAPVFARYAASGTRGGWTSEEDPPRQLRHLIAARGPRWTVSRFSWGVVEET